MRIGTWLAGLTVVAVVGAASAAPGPQTAAPPVRDAKALKAEARQFAQQLSYLIGQIHTQYVRPVGREELLEAALLGVYQAARLAPPADLRAQVRQAVSLSGTLQAQGMQPAGHLDRSGLDPVEKLLVRLREAIGQPEALVGQRPLVSASHAMARLLDPYSGVTTAEEARRNLGLDYERMGIGLEYRERLTPGPLEVETVYPGSPAQRAGLRPGDLITHVDDEAVEKAAPPRLLALRNQQAGYDVQNLARPEPMAGPPTDLPRLLRLTYRRSGESADRTATVLRERFRPETVFGVRRRDDNGWDYLIDERERFGYVRLAALSRGTSEELREVLLGLQARKARGVILDLRWCPGGYLNEAVETADLLLGKGVIATVKSRGREDTVYRSTDEAKVRDFAVAVLVNGDTSGGAELIAAALQDHRRAVVVGQRTLGKASVQTPLALGVEGIGFKLTSGTFTRPSDRNLHRFPDSKPADDWGVIPDEDARLSAELGKRLKGWWTVHTLRPGRSMERLPLDDPHADPQQQAALAALRRKLGPPQR